jgi:hypothetical protein
MNYFVLVRLKSMPTYMPNFSDLGIPIRHQKLTLGWKLIEEILQKRLSSWKVKLLSLGGRLVLINLVLTNMVLYI